MRNVILLILAALMLCVAGVMYAQEESPPTPAQIRMAAIVRVIDDNPTQVAAYIYSDGATIDGLKTHLNQAAKQLIARRAAQKIESLEALGIVNDEMTIGELKALVDDEGS